MVSTMVYVHTILRDVAGLFKVGRLGAYPISVKNAGHFTIVICTVPSRRKNVQAKKKALDSVRSQVLDSYR